MVYNMNGKNLILKVNGTAVAAAKSCSIDTKCDIDEVSAPSDGSWKSFKAGRKEWSISCSYLLRRTNFLGILGVGTEVTIMVIPTYDTTYYFMGMYEGEVSENVLRDTVDSIWYSTTEKKFVAKKGTTYYATWDTPGTDYSMFTTPIQGVNYEILTTGKDYEWIGGTTPLVPIPSVSGNAICEQGKDTGSVGSLANASWSFKGNGPLSQVTS